MFKYFLSCCCAPARLITGDKKLNPAEPHLPKGLVSAAVGPPSEVGRASEAFPFDLSETLPSAGISAYLPNAWNIIGMAERGRRQVPALERELGKQDKQKGGWCSCSRRDLGTLRPAAEEGHRPGKQARRAGTAHKSRQRKQTGGKELRAEQPLSVPGPSSGGGVDRLL